MDQLCIDQFNNQEVNQEVPKMRQYYDNAEVTLVVIDNQIGEIRLKELLFSLEKKEDGYIETSEIIHSSVPILKMPQAAARSTRYRTNDFREYCREFVGKTATPVALRNTKERKRALPIDGIYSILGLLPYGDKVVPRYKEWGKQYDKRELEEALLDVMKVAVENVDEKTGSSDVKGGLKVECTQEVNFTKNGIEVLGSEYSIGDAIGGISSIDGGQTVEGRSVSVGSGNIRHRIDLIRLYQQNKDKLNLVAADYEANIFNDNEKIMENKTPQGLNRNDVESLKKETEDKLRKRNKVKEIVINNHNLAGTLKVENFPNLAGLYFPVNNLTSLECSNCPQLKAVLGQQNKLTNIVLNNCLNITKLVGNKNNLTNLNFLKDLSAEKLAMLNISSNKIDSSNLNPFRDFVNLKHLGLGIYNHFTGSLEPLKNLTQLEELDLAGTDIDKGLIPLNSPSYPDKLNKVFKDLNAKTYDFLKKYDEDKNLDETRKTLKEVVKAMLNLEKKAREIHQGIFYELTEIEEAKKDAQEQIKKLLQKNGAEVSDLDPNL
ncbi:15427_t:CDS:10 [Entrophospora sp. SA101]|nr:15417_t:CDS:10 [Entrophospora sp. SA101]CAJ0629825.1 15427_t:CDS:10 [Entrophospora sp. SA101]